MKYIFIISFFISGFSFSQEIMIGSESSLFFYKGYAHKIEVNNPKRKKIQVSCVDCDTIYLHNKELNQYLVKVDTADQIKILIHSKNGKLIESKVFPCVSIPDPNIFIDDKNIENAVLYEIPEKIRAIKTAQTMTNVNFAVLKWKIKFSNQSKEYQGYGSRISEEVKTVIEKQKEGQFGIKVYYKMPSGLTKIKVSYIHFNLGLPPIKLKE